MDPHDQGFFHYNDLYPPLCVEPAPQEVDLFRQAMDGAVTAYLQESYREGIKHENAILRNGLCVGEAALYYFRELHHKRRKCDFSNTEVQQIILSIQKLVEQLFNVDLQTGRPSVLFRKYINPSLFHGKNQGPMSQPHARRILPALKNLLGDLNQKSKGYMVKLKKAMTEIQKLLEN